MNYEWLWTADKNTRYKEFMKNEPTLEDFDKELAVCNAVETARAAHDSRTAPQTRDRSRRSPIRYVARDRDPEDPAEGTTSAARSRSRRRRSSTRSRRGGGVESAVLAEPPRAGEGRARPDHRVVRRDEPDAPPRGERPRQRARGDGHPVGDPREGGADRPGVWAGRGDVLDALALRGARLEGGGRRALARDLPYCGR